MVCIGQISAPRGVTGEDTKVRTVALIEAKDNTTRKVQAIIDAGSNESPRVLAKLQVRSSTQCGA